MKSHNPVLLILLFAFLSLVAYSQTYNPNESLPFDSTYSKGTLPNGIKYIVHKLESGKKKAHIDFFYNFGSQDEKPNESGIAHLIEHLCFAGKEKYARFLKNNSVGMKYDIGATTGLGNTQFKVLDIPLTHPETIDSALNYLKELTFQLNVKEKDLAHEKKVVVEEWRLKTNIDNTVYSEGYNELMSGDLKVLKNGTLGDTAILNHFQLKDLKRFHQKWYRPENLTVIAFGDFDTTVIVQNIKKFFQKIPASKEITPRPKMIIRDLEKPVIQIAKTTENENNEIELHYKHDIPVYNQASLRTWFIDRLIERMFSDRMEQLIRNEQTPFSQARVEYYSGYYGIMTYDDYTISITTKKDVTAGFRSVLTEFERIKRYGFTDQEIRQAINLMKTDFQVRYDMEDLPKEEHFVECFYYILTGWTPVSFEYRCHFAKQILPAIVPADINNRFREYTANIHPMINIYCASREGTVLPTLVDIKDVLKQIPALQLDSFRTSSVTKTTAINSTLLNKDIQSGKITLENPNAKLGTTEWKLSNGMRVIIKPSAFKTSEVEFCGLRNQPFIHIKDEYVSTSIYGNHPMTLMGVGDYTDNELKNKLNGKRVSVIPLADYEQGVRGSFSPEDSETALQLINLYFTRPRFDENVLQREVEKYKASKTTTTSFIVFHDSVMKNTYFTSRKPNPILLDLNLVSIDKLKAIYNAGHSNPEQFTFIFSGNLKPDSIKSLVEKYLGSIHSDNMTNLSTVIKDKADSLPVNKRKFYEVGRRSVSFHSNDPKSGAFVYISSQGGYDSIRYNGVYATLAQNMFVRKCESIIRGKYANAYSVAGFPDKLISMDDPYNCQIVAYFKTNSTVAKKMKEAAVQTLKDFMMGKMDEQEFNNQKMRLIENRQNDLKSNYWWVNTGLHKYYFKKKDIITSYINEVSKITISDLKAFCKDIYSQGNLIDVMMTTER